MQMAEDLFFKKKSSYDDDPISNANPSHFFQRRYF